MTPDNIAVVDIDLFKGITYETQMQLQYVDPVTGLPADPVVYVDLTNKDVAVMLNGIVGQELTLLSSEEANDFGSVCVIETAEEGLFRFKWTATQLTNLIASDGMWRVEVREGQDAQLVIYGHVQVTGFKIGGQL